MVYYLVLAKITALCENVNKLAFGTQYHNLHRTLAIKFCISHSTLHCVNQWINLFSLVQENRSGHCNWIYNFVSLYLKANTRRNTGSDKSHVLT